VVAVCHVLVITSATPHCLWSLLIMHKYAGPARCLRLQLFRDYYAAISK
jgi:hypothetical protein